MRPAPTAESAPAGLVHVQVMYTYIAPCDVMHAHRRRIVMHARRRPSSPSSFSFSSAVILVVFVHPSFFLPHCTCTCTMANHSGEAAQDTPPAVGGGPSISPRTAVSAQVKAFAKESWEDCRPPYKAYPAGPPRKAPPGYPPCVPPSAPPVPPPTKEPPAGNSGAENMPQTKVPPMPLKTRMPTPPPSPPFI